MLRSILGIVAVIALLWFSLTVPLGNKTLVEHVMAIARTPEAGELYQGAKDKIEPAVAEAKERIVGEVVKSSDALKEAAAQAKAKADPPPKEAGIAAPR